MTLTWLLTYLVTVSLVNTLPFPPSFSIDRYDYPKSIHPSVLLSSPTATPSYQNSPRNIRSRSEAAKALRTSLDVNQSTLSRRGKRGLLRPFSLGRCSSLWDLEDEMML